MSDEQSGEKSQYRYQGWRWMVLIVLGIGLVVGILLVGAVYQLQTSPNEPKDAKVQFFSQNDTVVVTQTVESKYGIGVVVLVHNNTTSKAVLNSLGDKIILNKSGLAATGRHESWRTRRLESKMEIV